MTAIAARARGLETTMLGGDALSELDHVRDFEQLAGVLAHAGVTPPAVCDAETLDRTMGDRIARDHTTLRRYSAALGALDLDEDRRSLRAIVRGLVGAVPARRRLAATVPTATLPSSVQTALAEAPNVGEIAAILRRRGHPFAQVFVRTSIDLLELELALARRFAEVACSNDRALRTYLEQVIDAENATAALVLATRSHDLAPDTIFLAGGRRLDRATFLVAAAGPIETARDRLARAFAGTPLARGVLASAPSSVEDAALAWQLDTQSRLRRIEPLGLAAAVHVVLRRRDEARHVRRAAWRVALGGAA
jgi:vacuolar-type H+-ATPase subunit C/Vma6